MPPKRWSIAPEAPSSLLREYQNIHPIVAQVLYNRGLQDPQAAYAFLYTKTMSNDSPFLMKGMNTAVQRIRRAIKTQELVIVYGDFDADGVTSTALLVTVLRALKINVRPYIPHRVDEGYGLNSQALRKLADDGAKLVITVDCGIRSVDEVEDGKSYGLDMIITDHHSLGAQVPNALAVLNPKQEDCKYPEDMLAGVGVAYKLADALLRVSQQQDRVKPPIQLDDLVDLVAIGTIADLAPMNRLENRVLVQRGLAMLNRTQRVGLRALYEVANLRMGGLSSTSIGFAIGPRINAAGRLESAITAYELLIALSPDEARTKAEQLNALNVKRQELTREAQNRIRAEIDSNTTVPLIFAVNEHFQQGIVGLVAGRLTEEFFRPSVVLQRGAHESHASCRSIPQFDITHALDQCADVLLRHGGHAAAAGFTILNENIETLQARLLEIAHHQLDGQDLQATIYADAVIDPMQLDETFYNELLLLEPTGHQNPAPTFISRGLRVGDCSTVGKEHKHLKVKLPRRGQPTLDAIGFNLGDWAKHMPAQIDVVYQLEMNEWQGQRTLQLNLQDLRASE
jgi:single-stranded-DNA-specific exonuclease